MNGRLARSRHLLAVPLLALALAACDGGPTSSSAGVSGSPPPPAAQAPASPQPPAPPAPDAPTSPPKQPQSPAPVAANHFTVTAEDPESTFALDVDTASFAVTRAYLERGALPPAELVRVEEFVNSFDYRYPAPAGTFGITVDGVTSPFGTPQGQLVRVGIQGLPIDATQRQPAVLTLVVDVSGSMAEAERLPLVKESLRLLVGQLGPQDTIALVSYGDTARVVLEPTPATDERVLRAIETLAPGGSTNAEAGLKLGYEVAARAYDPAKSNRVILSSDGVANVGTTGPAAILRTIGERADQGVFLTTVGFGMGDYNDSLMEQLANDGNGVYAYVDTLDEARQLFGSQLAGTLQTIARDAKVQVIFNPEVVSAYRLLGYENRALADADFRNDRVDAGEIGAGHSVTALYEVVLARPSGDLLQVRLRWADPQTGEVRELGRPFHSEGLASAFQAASPELQLAASAATFAEILRGSAYVNELPLRDVRRVVARVVEARPEDPRVRDLLAMIDQALALRGEGLAR
jgi:Ca-activated chloride channel family protein